MSCRIKLVEDSPHRSRASRYRFGVELADEWQLVSHLCDQLDLKAIRGQAISQMKPGSSRATATQHLFWVIFRPAFNLPNRYLSRSCARQAMSRMALDWPSGRTWIGRLTRGLKRQVSGRFGQDTPGVFIAGFGNEPLAMRVTAAMKSIRRRHIRALTILFIRSLLAQRPGKPFNSLVGVLDSLTIPIEGDLLSWVVKLMLARCRSSAAVQELLP